MPVILPPGRLSLDTKPTLTGSSPIAKTIGVVIVAALAACAAASPTSAARPSGGDISLSIPNHFPVILSSYNSRPVVLPPGRAKLVTTPGADRVGHVHEDNWDRPSLRLQRSDDRRRAGKNDIGVERHHF